MLASAAPLVCGVPGMRMDAGGIRQRLALPILWMDGTFNDKESQMSGAFGEEILVMKKNCEEGVAVQRTGCPICEWPLENTQYGLHCEFCGWTENAMGKIDPLTKEE